MAKNRLHAHAELLKHCPNAYFQPPSNVKMTYPCIVYRRTGVHGDKADNSLYLYMDVYQVTVIDRDPDSVIFKGILESFEMSRLTTTFTTEGLHHSVITIYY